MKKNSDIVSPGAGGGLTIRRTVEINVPQGTSMLEAESLMQAALLQARAEILKACLPPADREEAAPIPQPPIPQNRTRKAKPSKGGGRA